MNELIERLKQYTDFDNAENQNMPQGLELMEEAIAALESIPAWVKCSERMPEDDRDVVICNMKCANTYSHPYEPSESLRMAFGGSAGWFSAETGEIIPEDELTHWIDVGLPAPPKADPITESSCVEQGG